MSDWRIQAINVKPTDSAYILQERGAQFSPLGGLARKATRRVQFSKSFQVVLQPACKAGSPIFSGMGAGRPVAGLVRQVLERGSHGKVFQSLPYHAPSSGDENAVAAAFTNGMY